jgi:hypothetical protein
MDDVYITEADSDLKDKKFTRALFLRTEAELQATEEYFKEMIHPNIFKGIVRENTLEDFAITSVVAITNMITSEVSKDGVTIIPDDNQICIEIVFGMYCLMAFNMLLEEEGINVDRKAVSVSYARCFLKTHNKKQHRLIEKGNKTFQNMVASENQLLLDWFNTLLNLIDAYVMAYKDSEREKSILDILKDLYQALNFEKNI